ncbi:MAG: DUF3789 domain-containing protein [Ruminococcus sp.]|nr:DUF3789 domain-containing protein [Ruminococcus sp.]
MTGFVIGLMVGGAAGVFVMALLNAASHEDDWMSGYYSDGEI